MGDISADPSKAFRKKMRRGCYSYTDSKSGFNVIVNKSAQKMQKTGEDKIVEKTLIGSVAILAAAATLVQCNNSRSEDMTKISYADSVKAIGTINTKKTTGVGTDDVKKLYESMDELYRLKDDEHVDKQTVQKKAEEAKKIELEIIHSKFNLVCGDNKSISFWEGYNGEKRIDIEGQTAFKNNEIPDGLKEAIHAAAQMDGFYYYRWDNANNRIQEIIYSLEKAEDIIMDKIYIDKDGKLKEEKAPTNIKFIPEDKREEQKENIIKYLEEGYTTYAKDSKGNYIKVIENGVYLGGCDTYDNPYSGLIIDECYKQEVDERE